MAEYIESIHQTLYRDVPQHELLDFHYRVLDYQEKSLAELLSSSPGRLAGGCSRAQ